MKKLKINAYCNDTIVPSTSSFNESKYVEWVTDGSGEINFYINLNSLDVLNDKSDLPKYVWLLESRNIMPHIFDFVENNKEFISSRCDGIFTSDEDLCKYDGFFYSIACAASWIQDRQVYEKSKLISMICSDKSYTPGHRKRLEYLEKFKDKVDLYGRGFNEIDVKEKGLSDYMFSIAIENACYETCFTEKITDCFATGTIPIYYGCRGVVKYFNEDGIIFLDDDFNIDSLTENLYYSKIDAVRENFEIVQNFPVAEDYIYQNYLTEYSK